MCIRDSIAAALSNLSNWSVLRSKVTSSLGRSIDLSGGVIITPPEKSIDLPSEDVTFDLSTDQLDKLLKAAAIYQLPDLAVVGKDGVVKVVVRDKKNDTSNDFAITVGETDATFSFNFKVENIKILPGTYSVVVSQKLLSRFTNKNLDLVYYIALEPDSTFE